MFIVDLVRCPNDVLLNRKAVFSCDPMSEIILRGSSLFFD